MSSSGGALFDEILDLLREGSVDVLPELGWPVQDAKEPRLESGFFGQDGSRAVRPVSIRSRRSAKRLCLESGV